MTKNTDTFRLFRIILRLWKNFRDRFADSLNVDEDRKAAIYIDLSKSATLRDITYWLQIFFSAGIATLGLVLNSPAVIIGAMLISPLMGPILSGGLALATGDLILAVRSFVNLLLSSFGAIIFAMILVAFLPFKEGNQEILSRTSPNTLDLGIALFSGAIGSLAVCKEVKGVVTSIPGVAIAVALMPPLCVVGYGMGLAVSLNFSDGWRFASGGGLLYLTNLVAITFMAMVVFILLRIDSPGVRKRVREWRATDSESIAWQNAIAKIPSLEQAREIRSMSLRLLMILLPLLLIFIPLTQSYYKLKNEIQVKQAENQIQQTAKAVWNEGFSKQENGEARILDEIRVATKDEKLEIYLRIFDNEPYTQEERNQFLTELSKRLDRREDSIALQLIEIPTSARDDLTVKAESTPVPLSISELQTQFLQRVQNALTGVSLPAPAKTLDFVINYSSGINNAGVIIFYASEREIDNDAKELLRGNIRQRLNLPNASISFERVSTEKRAFSFINNTAELSPEASQELAEAMEVLRAHPQLKAVFELNSKVNGTLLAERQKAVAAYFKEIGAIPENRLSFVKSDQQSNNGKTDFYRIALGE